MANRLIHESSPYLLQHAYNPVDWYPWCDEAFSKAREENKPIFLSIGYSTCHWCHVMAHESFENEKIAQALNRHFVCIKVDREERPDVDQVYMTACQAMTGSGGWPTSLFLTPQLKPFFAGTYFPPESYGNMTGFHDLILHIARLWQEQRERITSSADEITAFLKKPASTEKVRDCDILEKALRQFKQSFDAENGGFGRAPKFPMPHNLLFLMLYAKMNSDSKAKEMAVFTLAQMAKGGMFDHIGGGFSRYSTDKYFLAPHFEKMLYDNALMISAYSAAYALTHNSIFLNVALESAEYVLLEMTDEDGGFYSAQDADSDGTEGGYYLFDYDEIISVIGEEMGRKLAQYYGITKRGNFEGKNIPNRLGSELEAGKFKSERKELYRYRKNRTRLHLDDKILTSWNSLMIVGLTCLFRVSGNAKYLAAAEKAIEFIDNNLCVNDRLYIGYRNGKRFAKGVLDDYAFYCAALLSLHSATGKEHFLDRAKAVCKFAISQFADADGGYFMSGKENERLILDTKDTYDGAIPSGNTVMFFVLTRLAQLDADEEWKRLKEDQEKFLLAHASDYPMGHSVFLLSLLYSHNPPPKIVAVCSPTDSVAEVTSQIPLYADVTVLSSPTANYKLINGKTTFYVCKNNACLPPVNNVKDAVM